MKRLFGTFGIAAVVVVGVSGRAVAQVMTDVGVAPEKIVVPWITVLAWASLGLAAVVALVCALRYGRWQAKSAGTMEAEDAVLRPAIAPKVLIGAVAPRPPSPAPASVGTAAAAPAASVAAAPVAAAPATEAPAAVAPAAPAAVAEAAPAAAPAAPAAAPVEEKKVEVEPDQATFDRVLQEQLDKGVDRRVAEGRAKSAAIKAARANAGG